MIIGLTYDLRSAYLAMGYSEEETAEFDRESTIDALAGALAELGHRVVRIGHARQLVERLAAGERWDLVFNICEGLKGVSREAQIPAILEVYGIPYTFSDPLIMSLCLHKGMAKTIVGAAGVPTPRFVVLKDLNDLSGVSLVPPLFVKPVAEGTGKGVDPGSIIHDTPSLNERCGYLLNRFGQPVLIEEYLPGRELTVGLWGTGDEAEVLGTLEIILLGGAEPDVYSYVNKEECEKLVEYRLVRAESDETVRDAEAIALAAWRTLGCRDAGRIDLRCDARGKPQFLEVNPLAGLHPFHSDLPMLCTALGIPYVTLIERILHSSLRSAADQRPVVAAVGQVP